MTLLQIVTANIGGHRHLNDEPLNAAQIARDVQSILPIDPTLPTLIALQETTRVWRDNQHESDGELLARNLGESYRFMFAPEVDSNLHAHERIWNRSMYKGFTRVENGNGIITNLPFASWAWTSPSEGYPGAGGAQMVSAAIGHAKLYSTGNRDTQPRNLMLVCVESPFGALYFMTTHLSTTTGEHRIDLNQPNSKKASELRADETHDIKLVINELRQAEREKGYEPRPIILAGDFNAQPNTPEMRDNFRGFDYLQPNNHIGGTHLKHQIDIDHILIADPAKKLPNAQRCFVYTEPKVADVTDHRPVVAILGNE